MTHLLIAFGGPSTPPSQAHVPSVVTPTGAILVRRGGAEGERDPIGPHKSGTEKRPLPEPRGRVRVLESVYAHFSSPKYPRSKRAAFLFRHSLQALDEPRVFYFPLSLRLCKESVSSHIVQPAPILGTRPKRSIIPGCVENPKNEFRPLPASSTERKEIKSLSHFIR